MFLMCASLCVLGTFMSPGKVYHLWIILSIQDKAPLLYRSSAGACSSGRLTIHMHCTCVSQVVIHCLGGMNKSCLINCPQSWIPVSKITEIWLSGLIYVDISTTLTLHRMHFEELAMRESDVILVRCIYFPATFCKQKKMKHWRRTVHLNTFIPHQWWCSQ